jgi:hypothetical protein
MVAAGRGTSEFLEAPTTRRPGGFFKRRFHDGAGARRIPEGVLSTIKGLTMVLDLWYDKIHEVLEH